MTSRKKYRLALIEPSEIVRTGARAPLAAEVSFELTATAADIRQWSAFPPALPPDVLLVNPSLADRHGRTHIRTLLSAEASTLVGALLYTYLPQEELAQYDCVVEIDDPKETVVKKLLHALQNHERENEPARENPELSDREKEILASLVKGHTHKEIAAIHHLSVHTVISHRKNISRKTGIKTVSGLTVYALLNHLIRPEDLETE